MKPSKTSALEILRSFKKINDKFKQFDAEVEGIQKSLSTLNNNFDAFEENLKKLQQDLANRKSEKIEGQKFEIWQKERKENQIYASLNCEPTSKFNQELGKISEELIQKRVDIDKELAEAEKIAEKNEAALKDTNAVIDSMAKITKLRNEVAEGLKKLEVESAAIESNKNSQFSIKVDSIVREVKSKEIIQRAKQQLNDTHIPKNLDVTNNNVNSKISIEERMEKISALNNKYVGLAATLPPEFGSLLEDAYTEQTAPRNKQNKF